jgi:hypothetical protein
VHGGGDAVGKGEHQPDGSSELGPQAPRYHVVDSASKNEQYQIYNHNHSNCFLRRLFDR